MNTPLLSVIIPCYNQAHLLGKCIDSVLNLGQEDQFQIVVVNDGSPDETASVAQTYAGRILYVEQANTGLPGARNAGIEAATGTYLMFLDADDEAHPELAEFAKEDRNADVYPGNYYIERSWNSESTRHAVGLPDGAVAIYNQNIGPPLCCIVKRSFAREIGGFDAEFKSCEDWDFWIRVWKQEPSASALDIAFGIYKLYETSMASSYGRMWKSAEKVWRKHHKLGSHQLSRSKRSRRKSFYHWVIRERVLREFLTCRTKIEQLQFCLHLFRASPVTSKKFLAGQYFGGGSSE